MLARLLVAAIVLGAVGLAFVGMAGVAGIADAHATTVAHPRRPPDRHGHGHHRHHHHGRHEQRHDPCPPAAPRTATAAARTGASARPGCDPPPPVLPEAGTVVVLPLVALALFGAAIAFRRRRRARSAP